VNRVSMLFLETRGRRKLWHDYLETCLYMWKYIFLVLTTIYN